MGWELEKITRLNAAAERCRRRAAGARSAAVQSLYLNLAETYHNTLIRIAAGRWIRLDS